MTANYRHRSVVCAAALSVTLACATVIAASPGWREIIDGARCRYDLRAIRDMMAWIVDHSAPGDVIFTDDWDVFPVFFYHNAHNHYVVGLDPKFTHERRPDLWERFVRITRGQVPHDAEVRMPNPGGEPVATSLHIRLEDIREHFGAKFVITDHDHTALADELAAAPQLAELVYPSADYALSRREPYLVFRIRAADEVVPPDAPHASTDVEERFLSDLTPRRVAQGWGDLRTDQNVEGGPLRLAGRTFDRGLGTHAPATLEYDVPAGCTTFHASVGVDDAANEAGSVVVSVLVDGRQAFVSGVLRAGADSAKLDIPLDGAARIIIKVDPTADGNRGDHVDIADAHFGCGIPPAGARPSIPVKSPG